MKKYRFLKKRLSRFFFLLTNISEKNSCPIHLKMKRRKEKRKEKKKKWVESGEFWAVLMFGGSLRHCNHQRVQQKFCERLVEQ